jgi:DNA-binding Xre family transcriptional regulator
MLNENHIGSSFDSFLEEEGLLEEAEAIAIKRVIAYQLEEEIKKRNINKTELAEQLNTSRAAINRILDPDNTSISLKTLEKLAKFFGKKLKISFT